MSLPLSPRETEVLRHYAAGRRSNQVASAMDISIYTLKDYIWKLRFKLGARTIAQAVALGMKSETIQ